MKISEVRVSTLCLWPSMSLAFIVLIFILFIFVKTSDFETSRLAEAVPTISRTLSGEYLLGDQKGMSILIPRLKTKYDLDSIEISETPLPCKWYQPGCIAGILPEIEPAKHYRIEARASAFNTSIVTSCIVAFIGLANFIFIQIMLKRGIVRPLKTIQDSLEVRLKPFIERKFDKLISEGNLGSFEVRRLSDFLEKIATDLRTSIEEKTQVELEAKTAKTIVNTTQMLAHDVRKPFSLLKAGMSLLESASSYEHLQGILPKLQKSVDKALTSVNSMLSDIMHFGNESKIEAIPYSLVSLIASSLEEISQIYEGAEISTEFSWNHKHLAALDPEKMRRVVSNILGNACQAMKGKGQIWVRTEEQGGMIHLTLGNSGSFIPPEDQASIFEAFYTRGKRSGTGLGLAIAKKIVEAHSGEISVSSDVDQKTVEFFITLPALQVVATEIKELPTTLSGFLAFETKKKVPQQSAIENPQSRVYLEKLSTYVEHTGKKVTVAILDDEEIYRSLVASMLKRPDIAPLVDYKEFSESKSLLESDLSSIDFLISDVDLGETIDGFELTKVLVEEIPPP